MSTMPATPDASSIRNFLDRTNVPTSALASSYRPNSHPPSKPIPIQSLSFHRSPTPFDDSIISEDPSPFFSHSHNGSSITDISIHLEENARTPTKSKITNTTNIDTQQQIGNSSLGRNEKNTIQNMILSSEDEPLDFSPIQPLPSSVTTSRAKRLKLSKDYENSFKEDSRSSLLSENFEKLSESATKMPLHPAYNVNSDTDREILRMHRAHEQDLQTDSCKEMKKEKDISEELRWGFDESNKENVDPCFGLDMFLTRSYFTSTPETSLQPHAAMDTTETPSKMQSEEDDDEMYLNTLGGFELPEPQKGLNSKLGLLSQNMQEDKYNQFGFQLGKAGVMWEDPAQNSNNKAAGTNIPPEPTPQKLLHKNAKDSASKNLSQRNMKKLNDLKLRFPRSMYERGKKRRDLKALMNGEDVNMEWDENEAMGIDGSEHEDLDDEKYVAETETVIENIGEEDVVFHGW